MSDTAYLKTTNFPEHLPGITESGGRVIDREIAQTEKNLAAAIGSATGEPVTTHQITERQINRPTPEQVLYGNFDPNAANETRDAVMENFPKSYEKPGLPDWVGDALGESNKKSLEHLVGTDSTRQTTASGFLTEIKKRNDQQSEALGKVETNTPVSLGSSAVPTELKKAA